MISCEIIVEFEIWDLKTLRTIPLPCPRFYPITDIFCFALAANAGFASSTRIAALTMGGVVNYTTKQL
jgi:hypothetical protein